MPNWVGQQLGNYRLTRQLAKGGFGQVYLGEHIYLQTHAAIKLLLEEMESAYLEAFQAEFLEEARRIATLKHPHILRVLDFGIEASTPYMVMEYAAHGTLLDRHRRGAKVSIDQVVSYTKQIAQALQYAHEARLIHRDVKPANILLDERDTVLLSDFGIATIVRHTSSMRTSAYAGTASYMAPEQLQGKPVPASDQYALAIMVYEWLCGQLPYQGDPIAVGMQHLTAPIPSLRQHNAELSPAIEAVVQQALAKDPKQRFATVLDFADALEQASHPFVSPSTAANPVANVPFSKAPYAEPLSPTVQVNNVLPSTQAHPVSEQRASTTPFIGKTLLTYEHLGGIISAVAWSPDGTRIASRGREGRTVRICEASTGRTLLTFQGHSDRVRAVSWSPDGRLIASASDDKTVQVWEATSGRLVHRYEGHSDRVRAVAWSPDGRFLASASDDKTVQVWEASSGRLVHRYAGHSYKVGTVSWSPDGQLIASGSGDETVQVWEASSGRLVHRYAGHASWVRAVSWSPDGQLIASGSEDGTVQVWEAASGKLVRHYAGHSWGVNAVSWSPNGQLIASASLDGAQVWEVASGKLVSRYAGHSEQVTAVAWSPDGRLIASAGYEVRVWQAL